MPKLPDRWLPYRAIGEQIPDTRFIAFKVPLKEGLVYELEEEQRFTVKSLVDQVKNLGLVIDLTNTNRYYNSKDLQQWGIAYHKIYCEGKKLPSQNIVENFFRAVDGFLRRNSTNRTLIGVHCTHGLNRTGYLVCRYMIEKLGIDPGIAIKRFNDARGHKIERNLYLTALMQGEEKIRTSSRSELNSSTAIRDPSPQGPSSYLPRLGHGMRRPAWTTGSLPQHHHHQQQQQQYFDRGDGDRGDGHRRAPQPPVPYFPTDSHSRHRRSDNVSWRSRDYVPDQRRYPPPQPYRWVSEPGFERRRQQQQHHPQEDRDRTDEFRRRPRHRRTVD